MEAGRIQPKGRAGKSNGDKNGNGEMPGLRERKSDKERTQQDRKAGVPLQQPGVSPAEFCGSVYVQGLQSRGKEAGAPAGGRLYRNTRNGAHTGHIKGFCDSHLKKTAGWSWQVNYDYMQEHPVEEVEVVSAEQVDIEGAEMDGMWSFVHDKSQEYWLWWAMDHQTGVPPAYCFGTREHRNLDKLRTLPAPFRINTVYADGNYAYRNRITESTVVTGKKNTQRIERKHLSLCTWCSRLVRKSLRFSKLHLMHDIVVGQVINCRLFGWDLPIHLI